MNQAHELERFKLDINLAEYAQVCGFAVDNHDSSRRSMVMRRGDDKIAIATDTDGHGLFTDFRKSTGGSIIDFVQSEKGFNLGQVRKELRPWLPGAPAPAYRLPPAQRLAKPIPTSKDLTQVIQTFESTWLANGEHTYLEQVRGIDRATLADPRFIDSISTDQMGNAIFAHDDQDGLTGWEIRNKDFKGFATGGQKSLWHSSNLSNAQRIVFCEGAINALSHAQLFNHSHAAYVSFAGELGEAQKALIQCVMDKAHQRGASLVLATDQDAAGDKHAATLQSLAPAAAKVERDTPQYGDWNQVLTDRQQAEREKQKRQQGKGLGYSS